MDLLGSGTRAAILHGSSPSERLLSYSYKYLNTSATLTRSTSYLDNRSFFFTKKKQKGSLQTPNSCKKLSIVANGGKRQWDFGRFIRTVYYFNHPLSFEKLLGPLKALLLGPGEKIEQEQEQKTMDIVLVAGGAGGVGKRVVNALHKRGVRVRVLVRNAEKAKTLLGPEIDMVAGDVTKKSTLLPEYFYGVTKVVNTISVIVGPKEGDTPEREKYYQGIKFFVPEVKGDSPEAVEYIGMRNLIEAVKDHVGLRDGKLLFHVDANGMPIGQTWGALDDVVMGGVSESSLQIAKNGDEDGKSVGLFKGLVSTDNNGGFASIRTKNFSPVEDLSAYEGLELRVKGNGHRFKLILRTSTEWDALGYTASFDTMKGQWQSIKLPFSTFKPVFRARTVSDAGPLLTSKITSLQIMYSKFEYDGKLNPTFTPGPFELPISLIRAYLKEPITPRFVHVSSAGVTRPGRPGLDLSKQPPAVRLNKELGYIMDFKLKGEDLLRDSGIPYTVIRPCALTDEPGGADLVFDQGDNITGKISREDVAQICIAALESPSASDITFEVKSTLPFNEQFVIDPNSPPVERDFGKMFEPLQKELTGKEVLDKVAA